MHPLCMDHICMHLLSLYIVCLLDCFASPLLLTGLLTGWLACWLLVCLLSDLIITAPAMDVESTAASQLLLVHLPHYRGDHCSSQCNDGFATQGTLVGNKVYLFGGEDAARRPQGDLFVLDLADMEWQSPEVTGAYISTLFPVQQQLCVSEMYA